MTERLMRLFTVGLVILAIEVGWLYGSIQWGLW